MLLNILMISFPVSAEEALTNLVPIQPGYFISEALAAKIIELYPELEEILKNTIIVGSGYFMSDEVTIDLANYIQDINDENTRLKILADTLNETFQKEREMVGQIITEKDNIIELQNELIKEYRNIHGKNEVLEKVSQAAGIAAFLYIISTL